MLPSSNKTTTARKHCHSFLYYYTSMVSTLITAMCFEKVRKTTSNITAPFDEDENMHTRQPFFKKVCFCSFRHPLKYCNYCSLKMKIKKLIHFQDQFSKMTLPTYNYMISLANLKTKTRTTNKMFRNQVLFSNPFSFFFVLNSPFLLFPSHLRSPPNKMYPKFAFLIRKSSSNLR